MTTLSGHATAVARATASRVRERVLEIEAATPRHLGESVPLAPILVVGIVGGWVIASAVLIFALCHLVATGHLL